MASTTWTLLDGIDAVIADGDRELVRVDVGESASAEDESRLELKS